MKKVKIFLWISVLLTIWAVTIATAATDAGNRPPSPNPEFLRLVFIGALSGYVKPCG